MGRKVSAVKRLTVAALLTVVITAGLAGQADTARWPTVAIGSRVRVGVTDRIPGLPDRTPNWPFPTAVQRLYGTVHAIAPETLYVSLSNTAGYVAIPRLMINQVAMSLGRPSRARSAVEAGTVGAALFALLVPAYVVDPDSRWFRSSGRATAAGAVLGLGAGLLLGSIFPYERWRIAWIPE
jgi:hypothetical protein